MSISLTPQLSEQRVVIENVRWSTYLALLEDAGNRHGRMTYDQGLLEIMAPSKSHEHVGRLIGRLIEAFTEEGQIEIVSVASMTIKREALLRGFEADEAYYIQNANEIRGKAELDFNVDPAPDLVLEIDTSRQSSGKMPIYAAFQVPEVWQFQQDSLHVFCLHGNQYQQHPASLVLPQFPLDQLERVVRQRHTVGETEQIRAFRNWIREANLLS
jgi:Uma2 family endonuclease